MEQHEAARLDEAALEYGGGGAWVEECITRFATSRGLSEEMAVTWLALTLATDRPHLDPSDSLLAFVRSLVVPDQVRFLGRLMQLFLRRDKATAHLHVVATDLLDTGESRAEVAELLRSVADQVEFGCGPGPSMKDRLLTAAVDRYDLRWQTVALACGLATEAELATEDARTKRAVRGRFDKQVQRARARTTKR
jgi:hypothetical protein